MTNALSHLILLEFHFKELLASFDEGVSMQIFRGNSPKKLSLNLTGNDCWGQFVFSTLQYLFLFFFKQVY